MYGNQDNLNVTTKHFEHKYVYFHIIAHYVVHIPDIHRGNEIYLHLSLLLNIIMFQLQTLNKHSLVLA